MNNLGRFVSALSALALAHTYAGLKSFAFVARQWGAHVVPGSPSISLGGTGATFAGRRVVQHLG